MEIENFNIYENFVHIYNLEKINSKKIEFSYFVVTFTDKSSPWDTNCFYYGKLFTVDNVVYDVKIPYLVYIQIPEDMKYNTPKNNFYKRFRIDSMGKIQVPME